MSAVSHRTEHGASVQPGNAPSGSEEISILGLLVVILRYRGLVALTAALLATIVVSVTLLRPRTYTSESTFMPQNKRNPTGLTGLAAQFGFTLPITDPGQSPAFYSDLAKSRSILGAVVESTYRYRSDSGVVEANLMAIYKSKGSTPGRRRDSAIRHLSDDIQANTVQKTGLVNLAVTSRHADLSLQINQRVLDLLNEFNLHTRQSQAAEERRFTERRLAEVRQELRAAEDRLQQFLQRNRDVLNAPELQFQRDRLQREVTMEQEVYTSLAQAVEQAKIEEVRDTPVLTTVQAPEAPVRPDKRGMIFKGLLALVGGLAIGGALALWRAYAQNAARLGVPEVAELASLRSELAADLSHPWRALSRVLRKSRPNLRQTPPHP
jgi:uncharacterized protein involved in exopolysaccharide biosynthesis